MTQGEARAKIEEAAAQVHLAEIAAFELGCDIAAHTSPTSVVHPSLQGTAATSSRPAVH